MNLSLRYLNFGFSVVVTLFTLAAASVSAQDGQVAKNIGEIDTRPYEERSKTAVAPLAGRSIDSRRSNLARVGVQTAEPISLSLDDAIRKALESNNDIEVSRDDVRFLP